MSDSLAVGKRVTLHGLQTTALNGKKGTIIKLVDEGSRWAVRIDGEKSNAALKKIKPDNLKLSQDTVMVVVIPPQRGTIRYQDLPASDLQEWVKAKQALLEYHLSNNYYHYYSQFPGGKAGWMTMKINDVFCEEYPINENLLDLGWNGSNTIQATAVVSFSSDARGSPLYLYEPYSIDIVKELLTELAQARTLGHPTRDRITKGDYKHLPAMPSVFCRDPDEDDE